MMGLDEAFDAIAWRLARHAVDVVRYQPRQLDLALACGVWQPETAPAARWLAEARNYPGVVQALGLPHAALRAVAGVAARWFGPTASVLVRWSGTQYPNTLIVHAFAHQRNRQLALVEVIPNPSCAIFACVR